MLSQLQLLNKIIEDKNYDIISKNNLQADYFFNYKNEFNYIKSHVTAYNTVPDEATFVAHFPDFELQKVNEPVEYLIDAVINDYKTAKFAEIFNKAKETYEDGKCEISDLMKSVATQLDEISIKSTSVKCTDITDNTKDRFEKYLERVAHKDDFYFSTGLIELDKIIGGIDVENENMVIAARTGIGKTWMLVILAAYAALQGRTVGFYSGEMTVDKVASRIDTILGNLGEVKFTNKAITKGEESAKDNYKQYLDQLQEKRNNNAIGKIKVLTPNDIAGPATVDALRAFTERENINFLLIDQYSLLEDTSHAKAEHERVANISKAIKNLQVMKRIPIASVTQNNRTGEKDKDTGKVIQDTTQIALSDRIGQDATVILMLSRRYNEQNEHDQLVINILKARDGGDGIELVYEADFNTGKLKYIDKASTKEEAAKLKNSYETETIDSDTGEVRL